MLQSRSSKQKRPLPTAPVHAVTGHACCAVQLTRSPKANHTKRKFLGRFVLQRGPKWRNSQQAQRRAEAPANAHEQNASSVLSKLVNGQTRTAHERHSVQWSRGYIEINTYPRKAPWEMYMIQRRYICCKTIKKIRL
jgi:hypothetical protein